MAPKLMQSPKIWKLASDLGLKNCKDPVNDILAFCEKRIKKFLKEYEDCVTLSDLLGWVAGRLGTSFEEIRTDDDLAQIKLKYVQQGEKMFATLETLLSRDVFGVTIKKLTSEPWEDQYVSVIDCRGIKGRKAYYTKWHELAHLLILTDQMRLCFKRTLHLDDKDPEEVLVDVIAGKFGFYPPLIQPHIHGKISFEKIENLRNSLCPEASYQSTFIGFAKAWSKPCLLILCQPGLKKSQQRQLNQQMFSFGELPTPELRAVKVTANEAAKNAGFLIPENMRVPINSITQSVHNFGLDSGSAEEDLSWWESSDGRSLAKGAILVQAKRLGDNVYAIITPK
jgi:hypothetical protein